METKLTPADSRERRLVDRYGLANVLGVSPETVARLHREGRIPGYQIGTRLRFDVDECLERLRVEEEQT